MLKAIKNTTLRVAKNLGVFPLVANSTWRQQHLLILCYHGLALKDEHQWRQLYITPAFFRKRLELLARKKYNVLPLGDALAMLRTGSLPPKSVVITFDDGFYDFYRVGFPLLQEFGFPATVYQTTYYSDHRYPIFNLVLSYLFWRGAGRQLRGDAFGVPGVFDLPVRGEHTRLQNAFNEVARLANYTPAQMNEVAAEVAAELGVDYPEIMRLRMLQLMSAEELSEVARGGIDIQLHTHRHRTPVDEQLFTREIRDNKRWLTGITDGQLNHFCYPSGHYRPEFLPWLQSENVLSATTCDLGMVNSQSDALLLPRLMDSIHLTDVDFEGWLAGVCSFIPHRPIVAELPATEEPLPITVPEPAVEKVRAATV